MGWRGQNRVIKGAAAGIIAGLAGAWMMNQIQAALFRTSESWQRSAHQPEKAQEQQGTMDADDATMKAADKIVSGLTHRHLTKEEKKTAGPVVHYALGALLGGLYGGLAEMTPKVTKGLGTAYASAAWLAGDEVAAPLLGLSGSPAKTSIGMHANALALHLVYGATTEAVRRGVRALL